ncbi:NUDIX domain-containing protein [Paenibacillus doosanensis]|uniref:Bifunctional nicotinamide mononucleotide adenylyltransferase/ADP-ribose pyrophosphatase n=1 Tax=Paenibacillus konkukensis TaxID=2020716 RepID=A0ABY4RYI0_9BACL|nr:MULTISPECIES: NUDIX domain-containing protein [Paenibacillus]MCS7458651.1 NUDIX domain-containing protein [Paenibacillus doosanensis]UQZ86825.1 bifunctional nicotinamide mononucleotide adenylyltransferase/ADP-ribose pyrophosphatase [Paenibacillus konkukensis]
MTYHIRVRPTALIIQNGSILLIEYTDEHGVHYNLPGGGAEPGETLAEGAAREVLEETCAEAEVGPIAFVYEMAPHRQSGDHPNSPHNLSIIFECTLKEGSVPRLPDQPDPKQSAVKWIPLSELDSIVLYPNISGHIRRFVNRRATMELIEDHELDSYAQTK